MSNELDLETMIDEAMEFDKFCKEIEEKKKKGSKKKC